jgi:antitoxin PrlF
MKSTISEKGQVTIPKEIRDRLGLKPGSVIEFAAVNGQIIGRKMPTDDPVAAVTGIIKPTLDVDRYLKQTRGPTE